VYVLVGVVASFFGVVLAFDFDVDVFLPELAVEIAGEEETLACWVEEREEVCSFWEATGEDVGWK
jgi:hypothetical protein